MLGLFLSVFVLSIIVMSYFFIALNVNPTLKTVSEEKVRALTTLAINTAAQNVMEESFSFEDIVQITKDENGDISLIQLNTALANSIARKTAIDSQTLISSLGEQGIKVPFGSLLGIPILSGKGPNVSIKVYPVGTVSATFESQFTSSGINQTRHIVKILIYSKVNVVLSGASYAVTSLTDIVLTESIIVGSIPSIYLNSGVIGEFLDLVPS